MTILFKEINAKDIKDNFFNTIADEWALISAGTKDKYNMMTASWGFAGEMWGYDCIAAVIRPQRYTMELVDKNDYFTLSFYGNNKAIHKVCGSKSGRDTDKTAETGLTPVFDGGAVYFNEARLVIICKKLYVQQMKEECFTDKEPLRWYDNDLHNIVIGKIEKVLVKE